MVPKKLQILELQSQNSGHCHRQTIRVYGSLRLHPGAEALHAGGLAQVNCRHVLVVVGRQLLLRQVAALGRLHGMMHHLVRMVLLLFMKEVRAGHVDDPVVRVLVVRVAHRVVAVARLALVRIGLHVDVPAASAAVVMTLRIPAIGAVAVAPVQGLAPRRPSAVTHQMTRRVRVLTHPSCRAAGVGH